MSLDFINNTYLITHSVYRDIAMCPRTQYFNSPELCNSTPLRCKLSNLHLTKLILLLPRYYLENMEIQLKTMQLKKEILILMNN